MSKENISTATKEELEEMMEEFCMRTECLNDNEMGCNTFVFDNLILFERWLNEN